MRAASLTADVPLASVTFAGAISSSAPLLAFRGEEPEWDSGLLPSQPDRTRSSSHYPTNGICPIGSYYRIVTEAASHYSERCSANLRASFPLITAAAATAGGRRSLADFFHLCHVPADADAASMLKYWVRDAFDRLAMGNYPWPSDYIAGTPAKPMPAWPLGAACQQLDFDAPLDVYNFVDSPLAESNVDAVADDASDTDDDFEHAAALLTAVRRAASVVYNVSGETACYDLPLYPTPLHPGQPMDGIWDWQWCTQVGCHVQLPPRCASAPP